MDYFISISLVIVIYGFTIYYYGKEKVRMKRGKLKETERSTKPVTDVAEDKTPSESSHEEMATKNKA